ncbi:protein kinase [Streptomyces griseocarneus]|uniref:protein kinase n=1 Tax=Streptomyces griseocarneus TaxID=51201 RepID=UPI00167E8C17|nr:protein kinase [Streptomyces griseocarneus]MBZ6476875.1 protein kinase [Streptomyces griseocarneus]GHG80937.1 hypothetical protein GCM10018779_62750 [Streptomyces griseocarneus]
MDDYAGRVLADRYRLPLPPSEAFDLVETRAFDTYSGQEVLVRQIPLPEVVDAEVIGDGGPYGTGAGPRGGGRAGSGGTGRAAQGAGDPAVRRALAAATAAAQIPDHPRLDQVFHVFAEAGSLWIVSELVSARPLAALLAERTLSPHRAAEVAADVLAALRALHSQGWTHRNITARTVLICDDGRAILTGLAAGAAEEALCGYDPVPRPPAARRPPYAAGQGGAAVPRQGVPGAAARTDAAGADRNAPRSDRAVRSGAIAAYHAAARAAARAAAETGATPSTGASTWGGGSAASGTAPAPGAKPPWSAESLAHGTPSSRDGHPGSAAPPPVGGRPKRPGAPDAAVPGKARPDGGTAAAAAPPAASAARPSGESWGPPAGPGSALDAERARQARMVVVGAVTERWAPEQAWPVQENWQLAPPVGPAADLWALGALLFRVVQGHAPYPEESTAELVQVVCAEPPAYAEECGALRPVVESLMRKDPGERPEFEELRGWLRSLIRSAPEPDIGSRTVTVPSIGPAAPADARRLPVVRRRGEVARRRGRASAAGPATPGGHGRHKRTVKERGGAAQSHGPGGFHTTGHLQEQYVRTAPSPNRLGRLLVGLILLALIGAVLYALLFMPRTEESAGGAPADRTGTAGALSAATGDPTTEGRTGRATATGAQDARPDGAGSVPKDFALRKDPKGFTVAVPEDWRRRGENERGQVVYVGGDYELIIVPGRDKVAEFGGDPMVYQQDKEPELAPYRSSSWSGSSGLRRADVGGTAAAEGTFNWNDSSGRQVYVRNAAMILAGRYHLVQVRGPMDEQRSVDAYFERARDTYRAQD